MKYKRYMVFTWSEVDNVSPFECIDFDDDDLDRARAYVLRNCERGRNGNDLFCIFDRIEGCMVDDSDYPFT